MIPLVTLDHANATTTPTTDSPEQFRIMVVLAYPGYLRYFDSVLQELVRRGHEVELWFNNEKKQSEGLEALAEDHGIEVRGLAPKRETETQRRVQFHRAVGNFVRYLDPRFTGADYLRRRAAGQLPVLARPLSRMRSLPSPVVRRLVRFFLALERATPRSAHVDAFVRERAPDLLVVSPCVRFRGSDPDLIASARAALIPTVAAIASWDHLTTKGLLRGSPDRVVVWNEAQAVEAEQLHLVEIDRVAVTGAQPFDKWFAREPGRTGSEFADRVGLPSGQPYVLFVGSTASISAPHAEQEFVRTWIRALRTSGEPLLHDLSVLVRPHPYNSLHWDDADLSEFGEVAIWPRDGANPVNEGDRTEYFDSIYHSAAVVGINTSAMVEAAIIGRPVLTLTGGEFAETQTGTVHFRHLLPENGGFLRSAGALDQHLAQLAEVLESPDRVHEELETFVASFIRPHGLNTPATQIFADVVEAVARAGVQPAAPRAFWAAPMIWIVDLLARIDSFFVPELVAKRLRNRGQVDHRRLARLGRFLMTQAASRSRRQATTRRLRLVRTTKSAHHWLKRTGGLWESWLNGAADRVESSALEEPSVDHETYGRAYLRQLERAETKRNRRA